MNFFSSPLLLIVLALLMPWPIGTDRRMRRIPWITYTLIGLNVFVYIACVFYGRAHSGLSVPAPLLHDLLFGPPPEWPDLFSLWGFVPNAPRFASLFTYQFLQVSFAHLFGNMVFLWLFGPHVEDALGRVAFAVLYFGGGIAAGLLHMAIGLLLARHDPSLAMQPLVGASGAISAILAPFAVRFHRAQIRFVWLPGALSWSRWGQLEAPAVAGLAVWLLYELALAVRSLFLPESGGAAYWAHIGGFVFGLIAAELTNLLRDGRQEYLLQDARTAAGRGHDLLTVAVQNYRAFLDHDPANAAVRIELAQALTQRAGYRAAGPGQAEDRQEASQELLAAARLFLRRSDLIGAVRCCGTARLAGLALPLTTRERLRLAGAAEQGDPETAIFLYRALISEAPDAPEDEMARLKLGQILLATDRAQSSIVLNSLLEKYPESEWTRLVRDLLARIFHEN